MKKIRQNVFETNSSSTHSISINYEDIDNDLLDVLPLDKDGNLRFSGDEFGWGWSKHHDARTKVNYLVTSLKEHGHNLDKEEMLINVLKEQTRANEIIFEPSSNSYCPWGYIDHESVSVPSEAFVDRKTLRNFIFNKESWLYIGNDNTSAPNKFYERKGTTYSHKIVIKFGSKLKVERHLVKGFTEEIFREELGDLVYADHYEYNSKTKTWKKVDDYNQRAHHKKNIFVFLTLDDDRKNLVFYESTLSWSDAYKLLKENSFKLIYVPYSVEEI